MFNNLRACSATLLQRYEQEKNSKSHLSANLITISLEVKKNIALLLCYCHFYNSEHICKIQIKFVC